MILAPPGPVPQGPPFGHKKTPTGTKVEADRIIRQAPFSRLFNVAAIRSKSPRNGRKYSHAVGEVKARGRQTAGRRRRIERPPSLSRQTSRYPCRAPALFLA